MTKPALLIILIVTLFLTCYSQKSVSNVRNIIISGRVTDINNLPVNGAVILIDDKNTHRSTDRKGYYRVKTGSDSKIISILISSDNIGSTKINGQKEIDISLPVNSLTISHKSEAEEDEINVGYGTVKRKNLLSSVNKIDGNEKIYSSYSSIYEMLQGQPGGTGKRDQDNNTGTIFFIGSTDPLFVVDGSIVSTIEGISPQTVKSIEILKGAAASIYGSRGANGVILITLISGPDKFK